MLSLYHELHNLCSVYYNMIPNTCPLIANYL
uniref:Uncharacterized protein n=1 Tax=Anguilla anguilla TaxID=7936 RepID=A0A0E9VVD3_ANGAN